MKMDEENEETIPSSALIEPGNPRAHDQQTQQTHKDFEGAITSLSKLRLKSELEDEQEDLDEEGLRMKTDRASSLGDFDVLPLEMVVYIFTVLPAEDLYRTRSVSHQWYELSKEDMVWKEKCKRGGIEGIKPPKGKSWEWLFLSHFQKIQDLTTILNKEFVVAYYREPDKEKQIYQGEWRFGKQHGFGIHTFTDGRKYEGEWKEGKKHGHGTQTWKKGDHYKGDWFEGHLTGTGQYTWPNGDFYIGEWKDMKRHGKGIYHYYDGRIYDGAWKENIKEGYGTQQWPRGDKYQGCWKDDRQDGFGVYTWAEGDVYKGETKGQRHGYGTYLWPDGRTFCGYWFENLRSGKGTYTFPDGCWYEGGWVQNKRSGLGKIVWSDGTSFFGEWKNDDRHRRVNEEDLEDVKTTDDKKDPILSEEKPWDHFFQQPIAEQREFMKQWVNLNAKNPNVQFPMMLVTLAREPTSLLSRAPLQAIQKIFQYASENGIYTSWLNNPEEKKKDKTKKSLFSWGT